MVGKDTLTKKEMPEHIEFVKKSERSQDETNDHEPSLSVNLLQKLSNKANSRISKARGHLINVGDFRERAIMGGKLVEQKTSYTELELESSEHPFFQRGWILQHKLDLESPLLTNKAKRRVQICNGYWPKEWDNHQKVREALKSFDRLIVSLEGTSSISGHDVLRRKIYYFPDVLVGYHHAEVVWVGSDGSFNGEIFLIFSQYKIQI